MKSIKSYKEFWKAFYEHACDLSHFLKTRVDIDNQLKKQDAPRLKLQNIKLEEVYADDIIFTNIDFCNVDFRNCMFTGIDFINCTFDSCGIECCCFTKRRNYIGVIKSCKFKNVDISKSYFAGYNILLCFFLMIVIS